MKFGIYVLVDEDGRADKPFTQMNDILACRGVSSLFKQMGRFTKMTLKKLGIFDNVENKIDAFDVAQEIDYDEVLYLDSLEHPDEYKGFDLVVPENYQNKVLEESEE